MLLPVLIIFSGFNYAIDPENLFTGGSYERGIAKYMLQGKNVTDAYNFDERLLQKYFITGMQSVPDVVVLGSSREFLINEELLCLKNKKVINNCISGCTIEDELAIFEMYLKKGWHPKKIIIGVDPYYLNEKKSTRNLYASVREDYYTMCDSLGVNIKKGNEFFFKYRNIKKLFLVQYFQESMLFAVNTGNKHSYIPTNSIFNNTLTKRFDGSASYGKDIRERSVQEVENMVKSVNPDVLSNYFQPFNRFDENFIKSFEKLIDFAKSKGIEINLVMPPYHPLWYAHLKKDSHYKFFLTSEDFFRNFAHRKNIHFFGSLDPSICGVTASEFYDEMHAKPSGMLKVMQLER